MKIRFFLTLMTVGLTIQANAESLRVMESSLLEEPVLKTETVNLSKPSSLSLAMVAPTASPKMDFSLFKLKTNLGVKPYKFMDDMTFVGVPLFLGGWAIKGDKAMFRVNNKDEKKKAPNNSFEELK